MSEPQFIELGSAIRESLEAKCVAAADRELDAIAEACDESTQRSRYDEMTTREIRALRRFYMAVAWGDGDQKECRKLFDKLGESLLPRVQQKVPKIVIKWMDSK